jgi:hypothetical protein
MVFLETASKITPELAEYIEAIAEMELVFRGDHPIEHSRENHQHLWKIEWLADDYPQIDLAIRRQAVEYIFKRWRARLKSFYPYRQSGYRLYLYEDSAPTVSVVAETPYGFPYSSRLQFASSMSEVLRPFIKRSWRARFASMPLAPDERSLLTAIEKAQGSIGTRAAQSLGLSVVELRKCIEWFEIGGQVNDLRKRFKRRPATFIDYDSLPFKYKIFELRLPANYE